MDYRCVATSVEGFIQQLAVQYVTHGYSFAPYVYRQPYIDPVSNEQTGYYVIDYAVGTP